MRAAYKGLILAGLQLALVMSLGGKLLIDRANLPRVWARGFPYDPNMPIRGRYVSLQLEAQLPRRAVGGVNAVSRATLRVENEQLIAVPTEHYNFSGVLIAPRQRRGSDNASTVVIQDPVAFYIPEHVADPSRRKPNEELWVEVTIPKKGPPRPIRLGVKKDGVLTPLALN